jgi:hypothetical protein
LNILVDSKVTLFQQSFIKDFAFNDHECIWISKIMESIIFFLGLFFFYYYPL